MRPKKLTMSAFGSYADLTEINFDNLGDKGIYLICGDTGSGKTTIFDAISFALYGEASGDVRRASMFRSLYADPKAETFVQLEFECKGKVYIIKRSPQYERAKLRGEGTTVSPAENELIFPKEDGREPVSSLREVNYEVNKIVGIDRNQFSQIAMIAQGDFQKLILADTNERRNIFRKLFNTEIYDKIQQKVSEKNAEAKDAVLKKRDLIENLMGLFSFENDEKKDFFHNLPTVREKIDFIKMCISEDETSVDVFEREELEVVAEKSKIELLIKDIDDEIDKKNKLRLYEKQKYEQESLLKDLSKKLSAAEEKNLEKEKFIKEKAIIEESLGKYDALDNGKLKIKALKKDIAQSEDKINKLSANREKLKKQLRDDNDFLKKVSNLERELGSLRSDIERTENNITQIKDIMDDFLAKKKLSKTYVKANKEYEEAFNKYSGCKSRELVLERSFIAGQAGFLASGLKENVPCPVCGSLDHPHPAKVMEDVPKKEDLEYARNESSEMQKLVDSKNSIMSITKGKLENHNTILNEKLEKVGFDVNITETEIESIIYEKNSLLENMLKIEAKIIQEIEKGNIIEKNIPTLENLILDIDKQLVEFSEKLKNQNVEMASQRSLVETYAKDLTFGSKKAAKDEVLKISKAISTIEVALKNAQDAHKTCTTEVEKYKTAMETISETLKNLDTSTKDEWEEKKKLTEANIKKSRDKLEIVKARIRDNKKNLSSLSDNLLQSEALEKTYRETETLSKTLSGNLKQKTRLSLETYVQRSYFDNIIARANSRLLNMTNSQFELVRAKEDDAMRGQSGLGLDVIDHFCNLTRSIKTLSGGESFKASLALALGLSDEIQANAGGIKLDTMFIDEGFGTLDDESLESAMQAFNSLIEGNKLIGIISHVSDLKNRIDKQIVVTKDNSGISNVKIIT